MYNLDKTISNSRFLFLYVRSYVGNTGGPGWSTSSVSDMNNAKHFDAGGELSSGTAISADCGAINCVASS